uniref:methyl-accepting chemotaxis protein 3-like n=1 Tax=Pristiophorus japonicus TaxID=55135 RepID=UPI00398EB850
MSDNQCKVTELGIELHSKLQVSDCFNVAMQSLIKWEMFLLPAPTSVAILGGLVHLATKMKGFKLNQGNANRKSSFNKPESFQSCLMEVCNKTIKSFQHTRNNLNKIGMYCEDLAVHVSNVGEGPSLNKDLPQQLKSIEVCAAQSMTCAQSVEQELANLSELLTELLETCAASQSTSEETLQEVRKVLLETEQRNEAVEEAKNNSQKEWIEVSQKREELLNEYNDVRANALIDQISLEALKQMKGLLPKIVSLLTNVASPVLLVVELGKGLMFLVHLVAELRTKESSESNPEVSSFLRQVREEATLKTKEVQSKLEESSSNYNECRQKMKSLCEESEALLNGIKSSQAEVMNVSTSVELMAKGLGALGGIKSSWSEMINFLQMIPTLTAECLKTFDRLGAVTEGVTQDASGQMMGLQVSQAVSIMTLIGGMSTNYVKIYDKHLAGQVSELGSLLGGQGSESKFKKLQDKCRKAREDIHRISAECSAGK